MPYEYHAKVTNVVDGDKIVVDIDSDELKKDIVKIDKPINVYLKEFFGAML